MKELKGVKNMLQTLTIFDEMESDPLIRDLSIVLEEKAIDLAYYRLIRRLLKKKKSLFEYIAVQMFASANKKLRSFGVEASFSDFEYECLKHDIHVIETFFQTDFKMICEKAGDRSHLLLMTLYTKSNTIIDEYIDVLSGKMPLKKKTNRIIELIHQYGNGIYLLHPGFVIKKKSDGMIMEAVKEIRTLQWDKIYHYPKQKEMLLLNTKALVEGRPFQNVLLVGASGTGKSTSVKAVANLFAHKKLRLIQMQKGDLYLLPQVIREIESSTFKFILFIDDLSFEANEDEYKFLKSFIEGSIDNEAGKVAFYVTSNRRHLIKEIRSERENDIHLNDFIQEMTSLSDRFGLTLLYEGLTQKEYFEMVYNMYMENYGNTKTDFEEIYNQSRIYALKHGKMSGRVAMQFVKQLGMQ